MSPHEDRRIFISYAHRDGKDLALRLQQSLKENGFDAWLDGQRLLAGRVWTEDIEREIDTRQVTIALLSPGSYASEICRAEQLRALDRGNRVIPVLAVEGADRPLYLYARQYRDFTNDADYDMRLGELLADIRGDVTATLPDTWRKTRVTYLTSPPRVTNYVDRPEALHALRDLLFAENYRQPIALTALAGMGGIGKTVLAKALTDDKVVQRAFPDGIVWINAGKERKRDFIEEMREVAKALGDDLRGYDTALACEHQYRTTIANKAALIVVDDVWSKTDIEPLLAESALARFLFTTRDRSIGRFVGARAHCADLLDAAQSRELLASWSNVSVARLPECADEVITECGRLPLALSVVGAILRGADKRFWIDTLELLRKVDLSAIQEQLPEGQQSFFRAVEVSFRSLSPKMQERYKALAVLLEDTAAPLPVLQTLWNVRAEEARRIARYFVDRSLAQDEDASERIRLHDLQHDFIRAQHPDRGALDLIRGAVRLSSHVISRDPFQFASQMVGRLLPHKGIPAIEKFAAHIVEGAPKPWLKPLRSALHPPGTHLVRTLEGHSFGVHRVAISLDGRRAVSASYEALKVWDLETGRELRTLKGHSGSVFGVTISVDGRRAVSASLDKTLKIWDLETGRELRTLQGHSDGVRDVAVSADGRRAVSASLDKTLKIWDLETGRELRTLKGHSSYVVGVAVSADWRIAVSASEDSTLKVWDLGMGRELHTLKGHTNSVNDVALSPDGQRAVSASYDNTLKVWNLKTGRELRTLKGHSSWVGGVAISANGQRAVSASHDRTLKLWDLETGHVLLTLKGHSSYVEGVAVSADWRIAVSASQDKTLKIWDLEAGRELRVLKGHSGRIRGVAVSADRRIAVSASEDSTLKVWDLGMGRELHTLKGHTNSVNDVALSPDGQRAVSASYDNTLKVWNLKTGRELRTLKGHSGSVFGVTISVDGRRAISASEDKTLKVWDLETGCELRTLETHSSKVTTMVLRADRQRAVSSSGGYSMKVWQLETAQEMGALECHSGSVFGVLSADVRRAVSVSWDARLEDWDVQTWCELRTLEGHSNYVVGVTVSANGRRAVSVSFDNTLKVWNLDTGLLLATFSCDAQPHCCVFSSDLEIVVGDEGGRVHFLRLEEPKRNA
jgi:WD40 repeat protein